MPAFNLALFGLALWAVDHVIREYEWREVLDAAAGVPRWTLLLSFLLGAGSYFALILYDYLAFRMFGPDLPLRRMMIPSFIAAAVNNSAPAPLLTAGGIRYRLYQRQLTIGEAAQVTAFNMGTHVLGLAALTGVLFLFGAVGETVPVVGISSRVLGGVLLVTAGAYLGYTLTGERQIRLWKRNIRFPPPRLALAQLGASVSGWLMSGTALYVLVTGPVPWFSFITSYLVVRAIMLVVAVPGGIGVLEALMLLLRPEGTSAPELLVALLLYRVLYYVVPLIAAGVLFAGRELRGAEAGGSPGRRLLQALQNLAPRLLGLATFITGILLLITGAVPQGDQRLEWLRQILPPALVNISRFLGSIVGAVLILLAWALEARIRLAYELVRVLFVAGILLTLVRALNALDMGLLLLLGLDLAILLLAERWFPSGRRLLRAPMHPWWVFAIGVVFVVNLWVGWVVLRQTGFAGETWWRVVISENVPGGLRVAVAVSVVMLLFAIGRVLIQDEPGPEREERGKSND